MNQRIITFFIALFIIANIIFNLFNNETKQFAASKFALAADYYKERAKYYYGRFTGQIPSDFVIQHDREWRDFAKISDVLVLDLKQAEELFRIYVDTRKDVFSKIHDERISQRKDSNTQENQRSRFFRRADFGRFEREFAAAFKQTIDDTLTPQDIAAVSNALESNGIAPSSELRGLRYVQLSDKQREEIKPYAFELIKSQPSSGPMQARWRPQPNGYPRQEIAERPINEEYRLAKDSFLKKVEETLSGSQKKQWEDGRKRALAEIEDRTVRMVTKRPDSRGERETLSSDGREARISAESS